MTCDFARRVPQSLLRAVLRLETFIGCALVEQSTAIARADAPPAVFLGTRTSQNGLDSAVRALVHSRSVGRERRFVGVDAIGMAVGEPASQVALERLRVTQPVNACAWSR